MSRCLEFNCITSVHHFFVQLFLGTPLWCCPIPTQPGHPAVRPYLSKNLLSQVQPFRTFATRQLILLLDCWFLLRAPCCRIPRTANTQNQELQIPSICHLLDVSHNVSLLRLLASTAGINQCGQACRQKLLASTSCSIWLHPLSDFVPSTLLQMAQLLQCSPFPG